MLGAVDDDGRISVSISYDVDQSSEAVAELDRRYRESAGIGDDHWITKEWHRMYAVDPAVMAPMMHPAFEYVDHRPLAFEDSDGAGFVEMLGTLDVDVELAMPAVHRLSERGIVFERIETAVDRSHETRFIGVIALDNRLSLRLDIYEADDLDSALARYYEL